MKKLLFLLLAAMMLFCACGAKQDMTGEEFKEKVSEFGLVTVGAEEHFEQGDVEEAVVAYTEDTSYQIEFFAVPTEEQAKRAFDQNKNAFLALAGTERKETNRGIAGGKSYIIESNGRIMIIARSGKTFIYANVEEKYGEEVINIVKKLGYA